MAITVRLLGPNDQSILEQVANDVFDKPVQMPWVREFLADARHHLVVALNDTWVVGFASAVHYIHPDKPPELWINEVGVAPDYQKQGIGRQLVTALLQHGRTLGCIQAWVATERTNLPARRLYTSVGGIEESEEIVVVSFPLLTADQK